MKKPLIKYCPSCGNGFIAKRSNQNFCSHKCGDFTTEYGETYKSLHNRFLASCLSCGNEIKREKTWNRDFCSTECMSKWSKRVMETKVCLYCQKEYTVKNKDRKSKFCGTSCRSRYCSEKNIEHRDVLEALKKETLTNIYKSQTEHIKKYISSFYDN